MPRSTLQAEFQALTADQIAGFLLLVMRDNNNTKPRYHAGSLGALYAFELNSRWLGHVVQNGMWRGGGSFSTYPSQPPSEPARERFVEATQVLFDAKLIRYSDPSTTQDLVALTQLGKSIAVDPFSFHIDLPKDPTSIVASSAPSVFMIEATTSLGDLSNGTGFAIAQNAIATAAHCITDGGFQITVGTLSLTHTDVEVYKHPTRDVAVIILPAGAGVPPLHLSLMQQQNGSSVVALGFPKIPLRLPTLSNCVGVVAATTTSYMAGSDSITITNPISPGYSGGPILSYTGKVVALVEESTEDRSAASVAYHGVPIRDLLAIDGIDRASPIAGIDETGQFRADLRAPK